jgi:hypothetical protein
LTLSSWGCETTVGALSLPIIIGLFGEPKGPLTNSSSRFIKVIVVPPAKEKKKKIDFFGVQERVSGIIWNQESRSRIFLHPN